MTRLCMHPRRHGAVVAVLFMLFAGGHLAAQQMQYHFGGPTCIESGLHGVKQLTGGGYVAVGESETPSSCGGPDAMVVVTNANGTTVWAATYTIGTASRATDVVEDAANPGQLIVCGTTTSPSCSPLSRDIFIMRLGPGGAVMNLQLYGSANSDEEAWKIIQAQVPLAGVNVGDFIVAGSTRNPVPTGPRDAYLLRVNAALGLLWDWQYGNASSDDYFYGVAEVPAPGVNAGDIVAVGGSDMFNTPWTDVFVVRAGGATGAVGAAPQGIVWIDIPIQSRNDEARSVVVMRNGPNAGDIVLAGFSNGTPSASDEAIVMELAPNLTLISSIYFGDNGAFNDRAMDLVEDAQSTSVTGDVMVTGFTNIGGGLGGSDVFLQQVSVGPGMATTPTSAIYGGNGNDEGWSLANATNIGIGETPGYVVNGITQSSSLIGLDPAQLYLIKTNATLGSACNQTSVTFAGGPVTASPNSGLTLTSSIGVSCGLTASPSYWPWGVQLCYVFPKPVFGGGTEDAATAALAEGSVASYPNPVRRGADLHLRFVMNADAAGALVVDDVLGREAYRTTLRVEKGDRAIAIPTASLSAGTYVARIVLDGTTTSLRFVVLDR